MATMYQLMRWTRIKKKDHRLTPRLWMCPQKKGVVKRCRITTPRKPNSAKRPVAKVILVSKVRLTAHIPGKGHNLRSYSQVLIRGGGARDLPGVNYTVVRGALDLDPVFGKIRRRSIYGLKYAGERKPRRKYRLL